MSKFEVLTTQTIWDLATETKNYYIVGYGFAFGMSVWVTFFGGIIAFKTLPRQQFGTLQHKTFPVYFTTSMVLTSSLIGLWVKAHPEVISNLSSPSIATVAQSYTLTAALLAQALNHFVIGPLTSKTMFQRHKLEKEEGKSYDQKGVSDKMKSLNKRFGMLHGISSLANLGAVIALGFHGLWLGHSGGI